ncbi:Protoheme IX farnesyltransferase [invertebrate metagenome]|uniref:Protoheme IX farnesyltransferase n=1 Tax=invertebrate metagenome TaxID=1711999 RepID=A0A2H9T8F5_9ZZZZ
MIKHFLSVIKPGIVAGNLVVATASYFMAVMGNIHWPCFLAMTVGTGCVIASGCVLNNWIDRDIDGLMQRTRQRVMVLRLISEPVVLGYAILLGFAGFGLLALMTNKIVVFAGILGFSVYVGLYSFWLKRCSVFSTLVGGIAGACPPVMGYCSGTGTLDSGAVILFLAFYLWQIPHAYAIAIHRLDDYKNARIPVLPVRAGPQVMRYHMVFYILAFTLVALLLAQQHYVGSMYSVFMALLGGIWFLLAVQKNRQKPRLWARRIFLFSLVVVISISALMMLDCHPDVFYGDMVRR